MTELWPSKNHKCTHEKREYKEQLSIGSATHCQWLIVWVINGWVSNNAEVFHNRDIKGWLIIYCDRKLVGY